MKQHTNDKKTLLKIIESLLHEQDETGDTTPQSTDDDKDKKKKKKSRDRGGSKIGVEGALGRGRWSSVVGNMKSRAAEDPAGLLKDLGVKAVGGGSDLKKAANVLSQAISGNEVMGEAFAAPQGTKVGDKAAISINVTGEDLNNRNATKYLFLTLLAAENAGVLSMKKGVVFLPKDQVGNPTIVGL
jgi:hypothetical protein